MKMFKGKALGLLALAGALGGTLPAFAVGGQAAVDVTDVVSSITNQLASIGLVGVAILGVVASIAAYSWIRRVLH